ncbi:MAG: hypothetical protein ACTTJS_03630 [Wolinella sp.]
MLEAIRASIEGCKSSNDLHRVIHQFTQKEFAGTILSASKEDKTALARLIRARSLELIFSRGDIAPREYLYLYGLFGSVELDDEPKFDSYISLADANVSNSALGTFEKLLLIELKSISLLFKGDAKGALENLIQNCVLLNLHDATQVDMHEFLKGFCEFFEIPLEIILGIITRNLELDSYLAHDKMARRSIFNWSLHIFWNIPRYFNTPDWMELYPLWRAIFYSHLERGEIDEAMYLQFYIYHNMGNHFKSQDEWADFNREITAYAAPYYKNLVATLPECKKSMREDGKRVIGFLRDRAVENSPYKVEWSLLKSLMASEEFTKKYEVKLYLMGYVEKSDDDKATLESYENIGVEVVDVVSEIISSSGFYHSHLDKALALRERILSDGVDILISPNNGYDISDFLLVSRVAPQQIFWSHGNVVYDIEGIDKRISHCAGDDGKYKFKRFSVLMDIERFYNPPIPQEVIDFERAKYPKDVLILGTIGRLMKVDSDEYLKTIAAILRENPNTIYIAAGTGNFKSLQEKVDALGISDRFFMPGFVSSHVYGHIIDIWCDTFPLTQGESISEYRAKGYGHTIYAYFDADKSTRLELAKKFAMENRAICELVCDSHGVSFDFFLQGSVEGIDQVIVYNKDEYLKKANAVIRGEHDHFNLPLMNKMVLEIEQKRIELVLLQELDELLNKGK